jgi:hypothetical protein
MHSPQGGKYHFGERGGDMVFGLKKGPLRKCEEKEKDNG